MKKYLVLVIAALLVLTAATVSAKGITIAVPNDATNEGRALLLLEAYGVIDVDDEAGITATVADIKDNPLGLEFVEVEDLNNKSRGGYGEGTKYLDNGNHQ